MSAMLDDAELRPALTAYLDECRAAAAAAKQEKRKKAAASAKGKKGTDAEGFDTTPPPETPERLLHRMRHKVWRWTTEQVRFATPTDASTASTDATVDARRLQRCCVCLARVGVPCDTPDAETLVAWQEVAGGYTLCPAGAIEVVAAKGLEEDVFRNVHTAFVVTQGRLRFDVRVPTSATPDFSRLHVTAAAGDAVILLKGVCHCLEALEEGTKVLRLFNGSVDKEQLELVTGTSRLYRPAARKKREVKPEPVCVAEAFLRAIAAQNADELSALVHPGTSKRKLKELLAKSATGEQLAQLSEHIGSAQRDSFKSVAVDASKKPERADWSRVNFLITVPISKKGLTECRVYLAKDDSSGGAWKVISM